MNSKIDVIELKKIQLQILDVFSEFCDKNSIRYWLDCGTLLGAIRHKGYIPWDDDIDVGMLRADFDKALSLFNQANSRYKFYSIENNAEFYFPHGKVIDTKTELNEKGNLLSVNIDVFVYDNAPEDKSLQKKQFDIRDRLTILNMLRIWNNKPNGNWIRRLVVYIGRLFVGLFPKNYFVKKLSENSKKYNANETKLVGNFTSASRVIGEKRWFSTFEKVQFENRSYNVPTAYDKWLKAFYGDYMQLPPEDKRVSHHDFEAYYKD